MESDGPESGSSKKAIRGEVIEDSNTCKNELELRSPEWVRTGVGDLWAWNVTEREVRERFPHGQL